MNRTEIMCSLLPPGPAGLNLLDACTPFTDPIVKAACDKRGWNLTTYDIAPRTPEVAQVDLTNFGNVRRNVLPFYVVLSGDTLEHIEDWRSALASLCHLTTDWLILTVPLPPVGGCSNLVSWINRKTSRVTDPAELAIGHVWSFGPLDVMRELEKNGLTVVWHFFGYVYWAEIPRLIIAGRKL